MLLLGFFELRGDVSVAKVVDVGRRCCAQLITVAVMRKMIAPLSAMLRDNTGRRPAIV
jgi:hypothetical protein